MGRRRLLPVSVAMIAVLASASCALPLPVLGPAQPFPDVATLATALRERQLADRSMSFTLRLVLGGTGDADPAETTYEGEGAYTVERDGTSSRWSLRNMRDGQVIDTVTVDGTVYGTSTPPAPGHEPGRWRSRLLSDGGLTATAVQPPIILTQLDSIDEVFVLDGSSAEARDGEPVTEYRLSGDGHRVQEAALRHLGLPPLEDVRERFELAVVLAVDDDRRLMDAELLYTGERNASRYHYSFGGWGEPVDIQPPPPELVDAG